MTFDFDAHRKASVDAYNRKRGLYDEFAQTLKEILQVAVSNHTLKIHSIEARPKTLESFAKKVVTPLETNPELPKYEHPLEQITDLAGVRVITFFPRTVEEICKIIEQEFDIVERTDHSTSLLQQEKFGYQSVHFVIQLNSNRLALSEYRKFSNLKAELQVRTILQHAWDEIEHDITFKSSVAMPTGIRRSLSALAGMLEIADREFQRIQEEDKSQRYKAKQDVEKGLLEEVEITPDALQAYLDKHLGTDARISDFSYDLTVRVLRKLGFGNFSQVDECIKGYNGDKLSQIAYGSRQGQISRFEYMLLAGMGNNFITKHPWQETWYVNGQKTLLEKFRGAGITIGSYNPT